MPISICTDCHLALSLIGYPLMLVPDMDWSEDDWDKWGDGYFSWDPCHGCGSQLGGTRWEYRIIEPSNR